MNKIRLLHLYSGCVFAPLFVFFAASGIWQTYWNGWSLGQRHSSALNLLSTVHTSRALKLEGTLSSTAMRLTVILMAVSLVFTIALGVVMAFRYGHRRVALFCLLAGVVVPSAFVAFAARS